MSRYISKLSLPFDVGRRLSDVPIGSCPVLPNWVLALWTPAEELAQAWSIERDSIDQQEMEIPRHAVVRLRPKGWDSQDANEVNFQHRESEFPAEWMSKLQHEDDLCTRH